jgi:hypothetical protein
MLALNPLAAIETFEYNGWVYFLPKKKKIFSKILLKEKNNYWIAFPFKKIFGLQSCKFSSKY